MKRRICLVVLLLFVLIITLTGCEGATKEINASAVLEELLEEVEFSAELTEVGEYAALYFSGLPEDAQIRLFSGAGYYADEVALITVSNEKDRSAAMESVEKHLEELRFQYVNYQPEEVGKIDRAVVYQNANHVFLCITLDYATAEQIFEQAAEKHPLGTGDAMPDVTANATPTPTLEGTPATPDGSDSGSSTETTPAPAPVTTPDPTPTLELTPEPTPEPTPFSAVINYANPGMVLPVDQGDYVSLQSQSGTYYDYGNNVIRVDDRAYEMFTYYDSVAKRYVALLNSAAAQLEGSTTVHSMLIPTATGVVLPDDVARQIPYHTNQGEAIDCVYHQLSDQIVTINCFDNLMKHRDEYLYFRTDYHWNGLGAYYAYEAFCDAIGEEPYTLEERVEQQFDGFIGAHYWNTTFRDPNIGNNPDTVLAYLPKSESASMVYTDRNGLTHSWSIINDVSGWSEDAKYMTYAAGDQPIAVFTNPEVTDGSVGIVVKDSFGNPMMSYLVDHYSTLYEIDYRYWDGNLIEFAKQVSADDLIYMNCLTLICSSYTIGSLAGIMD